MTEQKTGLKEIESSVTIATQKSDPKEFFQDKKGLYVGSKFQKEIVAKAEGTEAGEVKLSSFDLTEYASDEQIESNLPEKHIFTESEVCNVIAALIEKQPAGEEGLLKAPYVYNLFYTPTLVVGVGWDAVSGGWRVGAWGRDGRGWGVDGRVFSPAP